MNVAFFLIPKKEVAFVKGTYTMRQAMEKMKYHRYTSIPILNEKGHYIGTLREGDLLWRMFDSNQLISINDIEHTLLADIDLQSHNVPIPIHAEMEDIISRATEQNFIPVVDDGGYFIGIIRRREIIDYLAGQYLKTQK
ncbi:CBS domain-containing protein [Falsibacillus albus]|uniref:CBS domain-containing protein n=1 Tax=Falsibacillus albus TaxID=2478915 RepID=A0A3L7JZN5_9BACI|nr:CBS domain-containing protein [Falsibacillus albus]RLQ96243.1 CBS domain-containing protein [Falsibacillus albus]